MKNTRIILSVALLMVALIGVFSVTTRSQTSANNQLFEQPRWEYKVIDGSFEADAMPD